MLYKKYINVVFKITQVENKKNYSIIITIVLLVFRKLV